MKTEIELHMPSDEAINSTRGEHRANKAKLRAGGKMTIDTKLMKAHTWPTIEIWVKAKRQYLTLSVGDVWRYETAEARDRVLSALQNIADQPRDGDGHEKQKPATQSR